MENLPEIEIRVVQQPVSVDWVCEECKHENCTPYLDFLGGTEYCDWQGSEVVCKCCGKNHIIDSIDWD